VAILVLKKKTTKLPLSFATVAVLTLKAKKHMWHLT